MELTEEQRQKIREANGEPIVLLDPVRTCTND